MPREIHTLAKTYHWEEASILRLTRARRRRYLALIDQDENTGLLSPFDSTG